MHNQSKVRDETFLQPQMHGPCCIGSIAQTVGVCWAVVSDSDQPSLPKVALSFVPATVQMC